MMPHPSIYYATQGNRDASLTALMNDAVAAASADYPVDQTGGSYDFVGDYRPFMRPGPGSPSRILMAASAPSGFGLAGQAHP